MPQRKWDFYFCRVDQKPAAIFLDLSLRQQAPIASLPHMAYIRLHMLSPRDDGLSSSSEAQQLGKFEDVLQAALCAEASALFVGRCTSNGYRDLYFYIGDAKNWTGCVEQAMRPHGDYLYEADTRTEPDWCTYLDFLYPSEINLQRMGNRSVCFSLQEQGDALTEARDIRHWIYLPTEAARADLIAHAVAEGFEVREISMATGNLPFGLCLSRVDVPRFENIDAITLPLFEKAIALDGEYDGWETSSSCQRSPRICDWLDKHKQKGAHMCPFS